jgi:hypothetical protein
MKKTQILYQLQEVLLDISCDICGKSCQRLLQYGSPPICDYEYATLSATWGYDSKKDQEEHEFHICEDCYDKMVKYIKKQGGQVRISKYGE